MFVRFGRLGGRTAEALKCSQGVMSTPTNQKKRDLIRWKSHVVTHDFKKTKSTTRNNLDMSIDSLHCPVRREIAVSPLCASHPPDPRQKTGPKHPRTAHPRGYTR